MGEREIEEVKWRTESIRRKGRILSSTRIRLLEKDVDFFGCHANTEKEKDNQHVLTKKAGFYME